MFPTKKYTPSQQELISKLEAGWKVSKTNETSNAGPTYWWVDPYGNTAGHYGKVHYRTFWNVGHKSGVDMKQFFI